MTFIDETERYMYEERAGIYEHDAGLSREDAERLAIHSVEARRARIQVEKEVRESFRDYPMKEADRG